MSAPSRFLQEAIAIRVAAEEQGRDLTSGERAEIDRLVRQGRQAREAKALDPYDMNRGSHTVGFNAVGGGPGTKFVHSKEYADVKNPESRSQRFSSGPVQVSASPWLQTKGTLTESTGGGPGGGLVPPHYETGVVSQQFEPLQVSDLFGRATIDASQVRYVNEGTALSGAAGVAEAGAKPESTLAYSEVTEPVKKIATSLTVSDELFEDAPSVESYLNSRLGLFVNIETERQLLRGGGTNELSGLVGRSGVNVYSRGTVDNNAVALLKVAANTRGSSNLEVDSIVLHPSNWLSTRLLQDSAGQFLGGGPFTGPYGNGGVASSTTFSASPLWGLRVALSSVVGPGTAIVGSFSQGARIWFRGGLTVESTNSHDDYFTHDLVAIRAEHRLALGCFRPSAFTVVSGLS
jgi:HK97 family phage major capsid protein